MGQQQVLLMILVMMIVGIATVVAINTFEQSRINANQDAIRQQMTSAATLAQAYYNKPAMFDGGENSFSNISISDLQLDDHEELGTFSLSEVQHDSFKIVAVPATGDYTIIATVTKDDISFSTE